MWPVFIPFSIRLLEKEVRRRKILAIVMGMGAFVSLFFAYILIFHHAEASIEGYHIEYKQYFQYGKPFLWLTSACYFIPTVLSLFISSIKKIWILGITILVSFIITKIYFEGHLVSIWCFFAAILSILILWIILYLRKLPMYKFVCNIEQKWTQGALRACQASYRRVVQQVAVGIAQPDLKGNSSSLVTDSVRLWDARQEEVLSGMQDITEKRIHGGEVKTLNETFQLDSSPEQGTYAYQSQKSMIGFSFV